MTITEQDIKEWVEGFFYYEEGQPQEDYENHTPEQIEELIYNRTESLTNFLKSKGCLIS